MSYNVQSAGVNHAIHLQVATQTTIASGDSIPYAVVNGTSNHGVTVSNGVVTLPRGEWCIIASAETTNPQAFVGNWYINGVQDTDFTSIVAYTLTTRTNLESTSIVIQGNKTVEIRVNAGITLSEYSDMIVYGVRL